MVQSGKKNTARERRPASALSRKLKEYSVIAISTAALIGACDLVYSRMVDAKLTHDAVAAIKLLIDARSPIARPQFTLEVGGDVYGQNPSDAAIASAVRGALDKKPEDFVILGRSEREFIQAAGAQGGWDLEYRAAQMERPHATPLLFGCDAPVTTETVIKALQLYRSDNPSWTELCNWKRVALHGIM